MGSGSFSKNSLYFTLANIWQGIAKGIIVVILARILGPQGWGLYAILFATTMIFSRLLGIDRAITYYFNQEINKQVLISISYFVAIITSCLFMLLAIGFMLFFKERLYMNATPSLILLSSAIIPCFAFRNVNYGIFSGMHDFATISRMHSLQWVLNLLCVIVLALINKLTVFTALAAFILSLGFNSTYLLIKIIRQHGIVVRIEKVILKKLLSFSYKTGLLTSFNWANYRLDYYIVQWLTSTNALGIYSASVSLIEVFSYFSTSIHFTLMSKVARSKDEVSNRLTPLVCRSMLVFMLIVSVIIFVLSYKIVALVLGNGYQDSALIIRILLIGMVALSTFRIIMGDMLGRNKLTEILIIVGLTMVVSVGLGIVMISHFGIIGAAWVSSLSYLLQAILLIIVANRYMGTKISDFLVLRRADILMYRNRLREIKTFPAS